MARASDRRNATTAIVLIGVVGGMAGLAYASVPFYRWFCPREWTFNWPRYLGRFR